METPKEMPSHHQSAIVFDVSNTNLTYQIESVDEVTSNEFSFKEKQLKKAMIDRTHTPPPPSTVGRINTEKIQKSNNDKNLNNSKKQAVYINPKEPIDELPTSTIAPSQNDMFSPNRLT